MAKEKKILKDIQRLYKCNSIDMIMFGWVTATRRFIPSINIKDAIEAFTDFHQLTEDEYPSESALNSFNRMWNYYKNIL